MNNGLQSSLTRVDNKEFARDCIAAYTKRHALPWQAHMACRCKPYSGHWGRNHPAADGSSLPRESIVCLYGHVLLSIPCASNGEAKASAAHPGSIESCQDLSKAAGVLGWELRMLWLLFSRDSLWIWSGTAWRPLSCLCSCPLRLLSVGCSQLSLLGSSLSPRRVLTCCRVVLCNRFHSGDQTVKLVSNVVDASGASAATVRA